MMSGRMNKNDKDWLLNIEPGGRLLNPEQKEKINYLFDNQTSFDVVEIEKDQLKTKYLKKVCLIKLLSFIPEYILTYVILGKEASKDKTKLTKVFYVFYRNKITLKEFIEKMKNIEGDLV